MKINMGVFFGGSSVEHEVSIISAVQAMHYINQNKYNIIPVYITKKGEMFTGEKLTDMEAYKDIPSLLNTCKRVSLTNNGSNCALIPLKNGIFGNAKPILINIAFPIVHGTNCEDGSLQGFFETIRLPYIGCDVCSSATGMDKAVFKSVCRDAGLPVLPGISHRAHYWFLERDSVIEELQKEIGYPMIIKPANTGSSVGISKVNNRDELIEGVELACSFAEKFLAERAITSLREINCSVLGDSDDCEASVCEEPFMSDAILSYEDKYMNSSKSGQSKGMASVTRKCPAEISNEKANEIRELSKKVFSVLGCSGVSRIDYLMDTSDENRVYVNEINTIPGSLAFYLWEASGIKYTDMIDRLVEVAYKRAREKSSTMFTINTNLLSGAPSFGAKGTKGAKR